MRLIDSHVNLHAEAFDADRADVIARARAAGVGVMLTICDRLENFGPVQAIAESDPNIWASVGVHPHHAKDHATLEVSRLADLAAHPKVVGIGETGLDRHYNYSPIDIQETVFRTHIGAARETGLPLIVHTREADDLTAKVLEEETARGAFPVLMHCYTSGANLARRALDLGAYFSMSGIMTFKAAHDVREVAAFIPLDRLILETDCPYLAPVPHRGRRNEPAFLADLFAYFCAWKGVPEEGVAETMAENFHRLFRKARRWQA